MRLQTRSSALAWLVGMTVALGVATLHTAAVGSAASPAAASPLTGGMRMAALDNSASAPATGTAALASEAPASAHFERVWHFGRVTGDLERIIAFYHDTIGLGLRGSRNMPLPFMRNAALDEFVAAPKGAQFRAVHFPIQGASHIADPNESISLEAFEYRGIDRRQELPALSSSGVSNLRFLVPDLERAIASAKAADVAFITPDDATVTVPAPAGFQGNARAVMVRDPDGFPVELMQLEPAIPSVAPDGSRVLGAMMVVVVADIDASLRFYRGFLGDGLPSPAVGSWHKNDGIEKLRGLGPLDHRSAVLALPGSALKLELLEFRGPGRSTYRPAFQDIGHGHLALYTHDVPDALSALHTVGGHTLSHTGTWTEFSPKLRGFYTRDPDGFFLEVIERN